MKTARGLRLADGAGQLAQRLAHESSLKPHVRVAHLALDLSSRRESGHRVDDHDVERAAADQQLGDLQSLLAVVGLRHQQLVDVDADPAGIRGVHGVLGVDEGRLASGLLRLGDHVQRQRRLAARLGPEDLHDPAARHPAHAQRQVEPQRAGGDGRDPQGRRSRRPAA